MLTCPICMTKFKYKLLRSECTRCLREMVANMKASIKEVQ